MRKHSSLSNLQPPAELLTLLEKMNDYLPEINSVRIAEGIENLSSYSLASTNVDELIMPSTMKKIESNALVGVASDVKFNDGLETLGRISIITDNIIEIPNSVTKFLGTSAFIPMTIKLPKNNTYTSLGSYVFEGTSNLTVIIPDTITEITHYAFANAKNNTLNFECSEENKPEGIGLDEAVSKGFTINYNYEYDFGE
ncbi:MAG: leucine-rich repeat protein [Bacilli bacterium]|nr:leucine-rich repeat protein [Bacilli bacterium]